MIILADSLRFAHCAVLLFDDLRRRFAVELNLGYVRLDCGRATALFELYSIGEREKALAECCRPDFC